MSEFKTINIKDINYPPASARLRPPPNPKNAEEWKNFLRTKSTIAEKGLDNPFSVRIGDDGKYYLMDGSRRYTAIRMLMEEGHPDYANGTIEVPIRNKTEIEALKSQIIGNFHQKKTANAAFIEACLRIINAEGCTLSELAEEVGMQESYLIQLLRIKNLPEDMFNAFKEGELKNVGNAVQLTKLPADLQEELFEDACAMTNTDFGAKVTAATKARNDKRRAEAKGKVPEFSVKAIAPKSDEVAEMLEKAIKLTEKDPESEYYRGGADVMKKLFQIDEKTLADRKAKWEKEQEDKKLKAAQKAHERAEDRRKKAEMELKELAEGAGEEFVPEV